MEDDVFDTAVYCPICGSEMEWQDCDQCGGEGEFDAYESDPLRYSSGDMERCEQCDGKGGCRQCWNYRSHP